MEHELGEIITLDDGRRAIVTVSGYSTNICDGCIFGKLDSCEHIHCASYERSDEMDVFYKPIDVFIDD